jgi:hypothetical protein
MLRTSLVIAFAIGLAAPVWAISGIPMSQAKSSAVRPLALRVDMTVKELERLLGSPPSVGESRDVTGSTAKYVDFKEHGVAANTYIGSEHIAEFTITGQRYSIQGVRCGMSPQAVVRAWPGCRFDRHYGADSLVYVKGNAAYFAVFGAWPHVISITVISKEAIR